MTFNLEIDYELADKITLQNLKSAYFSFCLDVKNFENKKKKNKLQPWQEEDLVYAKKMRKVLKKAIRYYTTESEAKEYFDGCKDAE
jgi:hypothetical protein